MQGLTDTPEKYTNDQQMHETMLNITGYQDAELQLTTTSHTRGWP